MKYKISNFRIEFYLFILFIIINKTVSYISFTFPYALSLSNGNILVIHKTGITICNILLSQIIKNITIFDNDEQILTEASLSKITSTKINNYIISIINDKIHIFNDNGGLLYVSNDSILSSSETAEYYTLGNNYYYLIGFSHSKSLYFFFYKYDFDNNNNNLVSSTKDLKNEYEIRNKALSCQYMIQISQKEVIVCFFLIYDDDYYLAIEHFLIGNNNNIIKYSNYETDYFDYDEIKCIKSIVNPEHTRALVSLYLYTGEINYFTYNINIEMDEFEYTCYDDDDRSRLQFYGLKVNYYEEIEQFLLSWIDNKGKIIIVLFDKNFNDMDDIYKYTECEKIYGYSIIYSNNALKYYIISDVNCNGKNYPINLLYGDMNYDEDEKDEKVEKKKEEVGEKEEEVGEKEKEEEEEEKEKDKEEEEKKKEKEEEEKERKEKEEEIKKEGKEEEEEEEEKGKEEEKEKEKEEKEKEEKEEKKEEPEEEKKEIKEEEEKDKHYLEEREKEKFEMENIEEIKEKEFLDQETMLKNDNECKLEKCQLCNEESVLENLCIKCNNKKEYYLLNFYSFEKPNYIDCVNNITKPPNFYFNEENNDYESCFYTCATCDHGGDGDENNCTSCELNHAKKPDFPNSTNCVIKCLYYYYYTIFDQYKCTPSAECPKDYNLMIKEKKKCIDNCQNDDLYKYQYNGECLEECPNNTYYDENENKCKDKDVNKCLLTENDLDIKIQNNITDEELEEIVRFYAKEFNYNDNHVSLYKNDIYSITLYKNSECILKLSLEIPEIDFGICEEKIKNIYEINEKLIIAIIIKKADEINYSNSISFSFYEPELGNKIPSKEICQDDNIIVVNNILYKLDTNSINLDFILNLTQQNINVFNLTDAFYTDICYHFDSPINKDIALKDRILLCFPNISLCEEDCSIKGVNLTSLTSICECKYNDIINDKIFGNYIIQQSQLEEIKELISQTNIEIISCYKDIFFSKYYISSTGFFIVICLIIVQIISMISFFYKDLYLIRKYIFTFTNQYILFLKSQKNSRSIGGNNIVPNINERKVIKCMEPSKKRNIKAIRKELIHYFFNIIYFK